MRRFFVAVLLVVACATGTAAGPMDEAKSAYDSGDYTQAARLIRPLAEEGNAKAQFRMGVMYGMGQGVPQDDQEAVKWVRKAAEQGDALAQAALGDLYATGRDIPQDNQEATKWIRRAAEQGDAQAQFNLGLMYDKGRGVPQDFIRAHVWYSIAGSGLSGDEGKAAMKFRDSVVSRMTAVQIGQAQDMARRCQQSKFKECD